MYIRRTPNCKLLVDGCRLQRKPLILRSLIFNPGSTCTCSVQNLFSDSCKVIQQNQTAGNTSALGARVDRECMDFLSKFAVTSFSNYLCYSCAKMHLLITNWGTSFMCQRKKMSCEILLELFPHGTSCRVRIALICFSKKLPIWQP